LIEDDALGGEAIQVGRDRRLRAVSADIVGTGAIKDQNDDFHRESFASRLDSSRGQPRMESGSAGGRTEGAQPSPHGNPRIGIVGMDAGLSMAESNGRKARALARPGQDRSRTGGAVDLERIEKAVREILTAVGEDPDREGLQDTPARVARMYAELFSGLRQNPAVHLRKCFTQKYDEMVVVQDIDFESMCEHHLLPFMGKAHIAYLPNGKIVGLSKLARIVEVIAHRPQVQEKMTEQLADLIMDELRPKGVAVVLEATHTCMTIRGIHKPGSLCKTSAMRGGFKDNLSTRSELMALIYGDKHSCR
jgi:GTP cyclohydrolase I